MKGLSFQKEKDAYNTSYKKKKKGKNYDRRHVYCSSETTEDLSRIITLSINKD